jgi:hypothetical protein
MARRCQPSLLRALHGAPAGDRIDVHGSPGVLLSPLVLQFGLCAISLGRRRLANPANAVALLTLALAAGSGQRRTRTGCRRATSSTASMHSIGSPGWCSAWQC